MDASYGEYSIAKLKTFRGMEDEGYNLELLRSGKRVAFVIYEGDGGCPIIEWDDRGAPCVQIPILTDINGDKVAEGKTYAGTPEEKLFAEFCRTLPKYDLGEGCKALEVDGDIFIDQLINRHYFEKDMRSWLKKPQTVFRLTSDAKESWRQLKSPYSPKTVEYLRSRYPNIEVIANEKYAYLMNKKPVRATAPTAPEKEKTNVSGYNPRRAGADALSV